MNKFIDFTSWKNYFTNLPRRLKLVAMVVGLVLVFVVAGLVANHKPTKITQKKPISTTPISSNIPDNKIIDSKLQPAASNDKELKLKVLNDFLELIKTKPKQPIGLYAQAVMIAQQYKPEVVKSLCQTAVENATDIKQSYDQATLNYIKKAGGL